MGLGEVIKQKRERRKEKLADTARRARISTAYLSKLENDEVQQPSPHILHRLAGALEISYADLMTLAGYVMPSDTPDQARMSAATFADLTEEERTELLSYLAWYRSRKDERARQPG
jgi:HTH-type transcriptional regulator, competence development regulator